MRSKACRLAAWNGSSLAAQTEVRSAADAAAAPMLQAGAGTSSITGRKQRMAFKARLEAKIAEEEVAAAALAAGSTKK
jgi:hypothetical protein